METIIRYETAWAPNIGTTERLHALTGWHIEHWSEAYNGTFDGWFICDGGVCRLNDHLRRPLAEPKLPEPDYDEEPWDIPSDT